MTWRYITEADLATCLEMLPACIGDKLVGRRVALRVWKDLLFSPSFLGMVIESERPVAGHRTVACGLGVFVSSAFGDREITNPQPGLNSRIIASVVSGERVVMNYEELGVENAGKGVDFVNMYGTWRDEVLSHQECLEVQTLMASSFVESHAGYHLNRVMKEAIGAHQLDLARATGMWKVLKEFPESDSALLMRSRESDAEAPYSALATLAYYRAPVLGFRQSHQRLLLAALEGATDAHLAVKLAVSVPAIKKRWLAIFTQCEKVRPELFGCWAEERPTDPKRGPQKRHRVLSYVRIHPEELRPYHKPRTPSRRVSISSSTSRST
jgi:hypothetical protein